MEVSRGFPSIAILPAGKPFKSISKTQELSALITAFPVSFFFPPRQKRLSYLSSRYTTWYHTLFLPSLAGHFFLMHSHVQPHASLRSFSRSLLGRGILFVSVVGTWDFAMIYPPFRRQSALMIHLSIFCISSAAKLLHLCPTLCNPIDGSPSGSPVPGILQARALKWVAISFSNAWKWKVKVKSLSRVQLPVTPWTAAYQVPPPMGLSQLHFFIQKCAVTYSSV